jgi:hypothetical protein
MTRSRAAPARRGLWVLPAAALVYFFLFGVGRPALLWSNVGQPLLGLLE